jgi:hypothetical protein
MCSAAVVEAIVVALNCFFERRVGDPKGTSTGSDGGLGAGWLGRDLRGSCSKSSDPLCGGTSPDMSVSLILCTGSCSDIRWSLLRGDELGDRGLDVGDDFGLSEPS